MKLPILGGIKQCKCMAILRDSNFKGFFLKLNEWLHGGPVAEDEEVYLDSDEEVPVSHINLIHNVWPNISPI